MTEASYVFWHYSGVWKTHQQYYGLPRMLSASAKYILYISTRVCGASVVLYCCTPSACLSLVLFVSIRLYHLVLYRIMLSIVQLLGYDLILKSWIFSGFEGSTIMITHWVVYYNENFASCFERRIPRKFRSMDPFGIHAFQDSKTESFSKWTVENWIQELNRITW
jgi:hypothetical protein